MNRTPAVGSFQSSRQRTTKYSLGGSPWPQLKNLGRSPAFAIAYVGRDRGYGRRRGTERPWLLFIQECQQIPGCSFYSRRLGSDSPVGYQVVLQQT